MSEKRHFSTEEARSIGAQLNIDWTQIDLEQFRRGLEVELDEAFLRAEADDEVRVVSQTTGASAARPARVLGGADILEFQQLVRQVAVSDDVARYAVRLVAATRPGQPGAPEYVTRWVKWGAGLRASQALILGGKARALARGRYHVSVNDVRALAAPVLRHRVVTNFYAESEGVNADAIVTRLLDAVPAPRSGMSS